MNLTLVGSRYFGGAVLEALVKDGATIVQVVAPAADDRLALAAQKLGIPVHVLENPKLVPGEAAPPGTLVVGHEGELAPRVLGGDCHEIAVGRPCVGHPVDGREPAGGRPRTSGDDPRRKLFRPCYFRWHRTTIRADADEAATVGACSPKC